MIMYTFHPAHSYGTAVFRDKDGKTEKSEHREMYQDLKWMLKKRQLIHCGIQHNREYWVTTPYIRELSYEGTRVKIAYDFPAQEDSLGTWDSKTYIVYDKMVCSTFSNGGLILVLDMSIGRKAIHELKMLLSILDIHRAITMFARLIEDD